MAYCQTALLCSKLPDMIVKITHFAISIYFDSLLLIELHAFHAVYRIGPHAPVCINDPMKRNIMDPSIICLTENAGNAPRRLASGACRFGDPPIGRDLASRYRSRDLDHTFAKSINGCVGF